MQELNKGHQHDACMLTITNFPTAFMTNKPGSLSRLQRPVSLNEHMKTTRRWQQFKGQHLGSSQSGGKDADVLTCENWHHGAYSTASVSLSRELLFFNKFSNCCCVSACGTMAAPFAVRLKNSHIALHWHQRPFAHDWLALHSLTIAQRPHAVR